MSDSCPSTHEQIAHFETRCRELGIPLTIQRRVTYESLVKRKDHPTVDDIFNVVKKKIRGVSRATVYRVLETFVEAGMVRHVNSTESTVRFDPNVAHHHHLVCSRCKVVIDFDDPKLDQLPLPSERRTGFRTQTYSVYFEGRCEKCRKLSNNSSMKKAKRKPSKRKEE